MESDYYYIFSRLKPYIVNFLKTQFHIQNMNIVSSLQIGQEAIELYKKDQTGQILSIKDDEMIPKTSFFQKLGYHIWQYIMVIQYGIADKNLRQLRENIDYNKLF
ncbi:hypothetical protein pb186bvf_009439 [Paramecium bursaria]